MLVAVSAIDLEHRIIPNRIVLPATVVVLVANTARDLSPEWAIAALAGFRLPVCRRHSVYPAGMGMGDVKLALLMGAALDARSPAALMVGMLAAMVPSLRALLRDTARRPARWESRSACSSRSDRSVALFRGTTLIDAYLSTVR